MWTRPNTFRTLLLIILEQQVSLASAAATYKKLGQKIGTITPSKVLAMSDDELRSCYFSRQKTVYARELAKAFISKDIQVKKLLTFHDNDIRDVLKKIKGIGDWTVDVYLLFSLQRSDVFPIGDLAMVKAMKKIKGLPDETTKEK
ncbi:MAG TPA: DNA-3-methyladenine glycosylase 2 family protein, partial [Chitinophagaceae bacterium]|nr:DNA-3-methyladenine glycosylase 2 family protein [Chitinophagaceae bacterium]